eukprot:6186736-Pleurochrysis_carterae.AAC.2
MPTPAMILKDMLFGKHHLLAERAYQGSRYDCEVKKPVRLGVHSVLRSLELACASPACHVEVQTRMAAALPAVLSQDAGDGSKSSALSPT